MIIEERMTRTHHQLKPDNVVTIISEVPIDSSYNISERQLKRSRLGKLYAANLDIIINESESLRLDRKDKL